VLTDRTESFQEERLSKDAIILIKGEKGAAGLLFPRRLIMLRNQFFFPEAFGFMNSSESSMTVNGPSLTSEIFM
jgi:hypothetical protein